MSGARRDSCVVAVVSSCTSLGMQRASLESVAGNRVHAAQHNATRGGGSKACAVNACDRWMRRVRSPISRTLILLQVEYPAPLQYAQPRLSVRPRPGRCMRSMMCSTRACTVLPLKPQATTARRQCEVYKALGQRPSLPSCQRGCTATEGYTLDLLAYIHAMQCIRSRTRPAHTAAAAL